jgi:hypothetical protein
MDLICCLETFTDLATALIGARARIDMVIVVVDLL